jgi:hypothetical protein
VTSGDFQIGKWFVFAVWMVLPILAYVGPNNDLVLFSNDGPLGLMAADWHAVPATFTGCWLDLNLVGQNLGQNPITISNLLVIVIPLAVFILAHTIIGPILYAGLLYLIYRELSFEGLMREIKEVIQQRRFFIETLVLVVLVPSLLVAIGFLVPILL